MSQEPIESHDAYLHQKKSSISASGARAKVRLGDVKGRFTSKKNLVFFALILIYLLFPFIKINGHPIILIDIMHRQFFLFGLTFNSQDFYLVFFLLSGVFFLLFFITALVGRIWCGWACPQTVFLEGVFRKIERLIEGSRAEQVLLSQSPWLGKRLGLFIIKHAFFILASLLITHIFLSFFVSLDQLLLFLTQDPRENWFTFLWMLVMSGIIYINFAWFREQLCLIVCPYGRLQSLLIDDDSIVIGYDENRGEPRGKKNQSDRGDCIDCYRCVDVCPTAIDIREGLQMECVGCANCIDACDEIMIKLDQKPGLIRYDSLNGLNQNKKRILRPRIYTYIAFLTLGLIVLTLTLTYHYKPFEAHIIRQSSAPYALENGMIRNQYYILIANKGSKKAHFAILLPDRPDLKFILPLHEIELESFSDKKIPLFVNQNQINYTKDFLFKIQVKNLDNQKIQNAEIQFLGPNQ